ncbi:glycosyltransferase family 87 protein [Actinomadura scrupuli]|uniref:glycosyltransferase family 87 protein n=1 Tax=Actinomadura scrupuli TaxID=559629 RepID=UPI003D97DE70
MSQSPSDADVLAGSPIDDDGAKPRDPAGSAFRRFVDGGPLLLVLSTLSVCALGFLQKAPCQSRSFDFVPTVRNACYTDIYPLYFGRGLVDGKIPYFDQIKEPVEYPVLTGWFMQAVNTVVGWFVHPAGDADAVRSGQGMAFYNLTALVLAVLAVATVFAVSYAAGRRSRKAGLMVALSPGLLLAAYINWDLLAVALAALAVTAWSRKRHVSAGVLLGLAISAKFYPVIFLWPFLLLCARAGKWRELGRLFGGTAISWLVVNVPVMLFAWDGWVRFYTFSQERGVDWGSVFFYLMNGRGWTFVSDVPTLNHVAEASFAVLCLAIGALALLAPRRPRLPQLLFLVLAAFMLTNKVWSPQYILWLLPLIVLARPRLPAYLLWQAGEFVYFIGIWWYLLAISTQQPGVGAHGLWEDLSRFDAPATGIDQNLYFVALFARFLTVLMLVVLVVVDILRPARDVVRLDGDDDPAGGVLDGAGDRLVLRWPGRRSYAPA